MAYLTIAELKTKSVIDSIKNATTEDDIRLQLLLDYCSALIDSYVGFRFVPETNSSIYVDGEGRKNSPYKNESIVSHLLPMWKQTMCTIMRI
jgi:hypothetical protein